MPLRDAVPEISGSFHMNLMLSRRAALIGAACLLPISRLYADTLPKATDIKAAEQKIAELEKAHGGRLGVMVLDTGSNVQFGHRINERFAMCSTFKFLAAAAVLKRVDEGDERLDRKIVYTEKDLLSYAPVTREHVADGSMSLSDLCAAAVELSDNTAANLILKTLGGPSGITHLAASIGDPITRLDRTETTLNTAIAGDKRDTTTPKAMIGDLQTLLLGHVLSDDSRQQLENWMIACKTGAKRLRAGLPADWQVGDKTGSGDNNTANTIAIIRPPKGAPILAAVYYTASSADHDQQDAVHMAIGHLIAGTFQRD
jgi:beta-lactamase class A